MLGSKNTKLYLGDKQVYPEELNGAVVTCDSTTYNGSLQTASNIVVKLSGETLVVNQDYVITQNNGGTNAGSYPVIVTGINYFSSTASTSFIINKAAGSVSNAPTAKSLTYNGSAQALVNAGSGTGTMMYKVGSGSWSSSIPSGTNATSYTVYYKASASTNYNESASGSVNVTINKVTPTVTAPTAKSLTYNGSAQALVNAGSTNWGTLKYSLDGSSYSTSIPSGTNATSYTVYYRVDGDSNINNVTAKTVTVTIAKADTTYTAPTAKSLTYNTSAQALLNAGAVTGGTIYYSSDNSTWSTTIPTGTNANTYTSYWKIVGDNNHNDKTSVSISTTISAKTVSSPTIILSQDSYVYSNTAYQPTPTVKDGTVTISSSEYTVSYSNNTNVGTATCTITDKTGGNYTVSGSKTFTITKVTPTVTAPTPKTLTFNNANQVLANAGSTDWGTIQYCLNNSGGTYSTTVPSASAANTTYKVWYKVVGNSNINDVAPASIDCMIAEKRVTTPTIVLDPSSYTYNGSACQPSVTVKDGTVVIPTSEYTKSYSNNTNAGTATVTISDNTAGNYYISGTTTFTISKASGSVSTAPTAKSLTYNNAAQQLVTAGSGTGTMMYKLDSGSWGTSIPTATNATSYTVYYKASASTNYNESASGSVSVTINKVTPTVTAPKACGLTYNGSAQNLVSGGSTNYGTLVYSTTKTGTYSTTIPQGTNATAYTVWYKVSGNTNVNDTTPDSVAITIAKANTTYTSPTANNRTYDTTSKALLNAGAVTGGTIYYSSDNSTWSTTIPSQTNAGSYTTYWKITGDSNHSDKASASISTTVSPKTVSSPTITLSQSTYTYANTAFQPTPTVKDGSVTIASSEYTVSYSNNTNVGTATCTITDKSGGNYTVSGSKTFTISCYSATAPTAKSLTYNTSAQALVNAGSTSYGTMVYCSTSGGTFSTTIPTGTNAGSYEVWWKVTGNTNVCNTTATKVACSIGAKTVSSPTITLSQSTYTYANTAYQPTPTVKDGSTTIASTEYTVSYSNNTNVGTATCTITDKSGGNYTVSGSKTFTINCASCTAPTAKSLTWNGSAQALVNAGSTSYGTMVYSTDNSTWGTAIPSGTNATSYTVYWKVTGNTNVCCTASSSVACSIAKAAMTYTAPKVTTYTYGNTARALLSGGTATGGSIQYSTSQTGTYSTTVPTQTNAGSYDTWWKAVPDANHSGGTNPAKLTTTISCYSATAPTAKSLTYNTSAQALANAGSTSYGTMVYCSTSSGTFSTTIPTGTNAGSYEVWWKVTGNTNVCNTAATKVACSIGAKTVSSPTITLSPASYTWSNSNCEPTPTVKDGSTTIASSEYTVSYSNNKAAGTGTCTITDKSGGNYTVSGSKTFTISKYTPTAPTAKSLTWTGSAQALVNAGSTSFGSIVYSTTSGGTYTTTIPTGTNAGSYEVWWKLSGDTTVTTNCNNTAATKISCSIAKVAMTYTAPKAATRNYTGSAQQIVSGQAANGGSIYYATSSAGASSSTTVPTQTNAGTYSTYWKAVPDSNHSGGTSSWAEISSCVINKVAMTYTAPSATTYAYGNTARALVSGGTAGGGSIQYSTAQTGTYSATVPTQTNAGTYTTWWKAVPDSNHSGGTNAASISTTIAKANQSAPTATGATTTYNTTATATASGGGGIGSIEWESAQSQTSVGSHTTRARWTGNGNYNASPWSNSVTVQMNKATGSVSTVPVNTNYTYNGTARAVASAGSGTGTMYYRLGTSGNFSTTMPTMTNAGSNTLYYYAAESTNYTQSSTGSITVTVQKANISPTVSISNWTYGGTASNPSVAGNSGSGTVTYYYKLSSASSWSTTKPSNAGSYNIKADIAATTNYNSGTCTSNFTINKASRTLSWSTAPTEVTVGSTITVAAAPSAGSGDGTITYSSSDSSVATVNGAVITGIDAGSCTITATIAEGTNYLSASISYTLTVKVSYFTFNVTTGGDIKWSGSTTDNTLSYSKDNGTTWTSVNSADTISVSAGDKVMWKGTPTPQATGIGRFSGDTNARYNVEGNAMSLLFGDNFSEQTSLRGKDNAFLCLFSGNTNVVNAENLSLPATTLAQNAYKWMFIECASLTTAPSLPATSFSGAQSCYYGMFSNCTSLTTTPELPATTLNNNCYRNMFYHCISLTTVPELPATKLSGSCYASMFSNCTSLTTVPSNLLPATTLTISAYTGMFSGCTSLATAPVLSATTLANHCYDGMFKGCTSLTRAPELPATTLANYCYYGMFSGCTNLNYIKALFTTTPSNTYTRYWVSNVAEKGIFVKNPSATWTTTGTSAVPTGWIAITGITEITGTTSLSSPSYVTITGATEIGYSKKSTNQTVYISKDHTNWTEMTTNAVYTTDSSTIYMCGKLTANNTETDYTNFYIGGSSVSISGNFNSVWSYDDVNASLKQHCGRNMFYGCTSLTTAPELPATNLRNYCYLGMFQGCKSLTTPPSTLPATYLEQSCYLSMFNGCTSLTTTPTISGTRMANFCYSYMFSGCTSLTTAPELPATDLSTGANCYYYMFANCTSLTTAPVLSAATLSDSCYYNMFQGCASLTTAPVLSATTLAVSCYQGMFNGCTSLTTTPELPATTLASDCYRGMFQNCTNLNSITCLATDISASYCTQNWVSGVAASGTFVGKSAANWSDGASGIPNGWTKQLS